MSWKIGIKEQAATQLENGSKTSPGPWISVYSRILKLVGNISFLGEQMYWLFA